MNILDAMKRQRDDIKLWTTNNLNVKLSKNLGEEEKNKMLITDHKGDVITQDLPFYDTTKAIFDWDGNTEEDDSYYSYEYKGTEDIEVNFINMYQKGNPIPYNDMLGATVVSVDKDGVEKETIITADMILCDEDNQDAWILNSHQWNDGFILISKPDDSDINISSGFHDFVGPPPAGLYVNIIGPGCNAYVKQIKRRDLKQLDPKFIPGDIGGNSLPNNLIYFSVSDLDADKFESATINELTYYKLTDRVFTLEELKDCRCNILSTNFSPVDDTMTFNETNDMISISVKGDSITTVDNLFIVVKNTINNITPGLYVYFKFKDSLFSGMKQILYNYDLDSIINPKFTNAYKSLSACSAILVNVNNIIKDSTTSSNLYEGTLPSCNIVPGAYEYNVIISSPLGVDGIYYNENIWGNDIIEIDGVNHVSIGNLGILFEDQTDTGLEFLLLYNTDDGSYKWYNRTDYDTNYQVTIKHVQKMFSGKTLEKKYVSTDVLDWNYIKETPFIYHRFDGNIEDGTTYIVYNNEMYFRLTDNVYAEDQLADCTLVREEIVDGVDLDDPQYYYEFKKSYFEESDDGNIVSLYAECENENTNYEQGTKIFINLLMVKEDKTNFPKGIYVKDGTNAFRFYDMPTSDSKAVKIFDLDEWGFDGNSCDIPSDKVDIVKNAIASENDIEFRFTLDKGGLVGKQIRLISPSASINSNTSSLYLATCSGVYIHTVYTLLITGGSPATDYTKYGIVLDYYDLARKEEDVDAKIGFTSYRIPSDFGASTDSTILDMIKLMASKSMIYFAVADDSTYTGVYNEVINDFYNLSSNGVKTYGNAGVIHIHKNNEKMAHVTWKDYDSNAEFRKAYRCTNSTSNEWAEVEWSSLVTNSIDGTFIGNNIYTGLKTSAQDGIGGCVLGSNGVLCLQGKDETPNKIFPQIRFFESGEKNYSSRIYSNLDVMHFEGSQNYNFDKTVLSAGTFGAGGKSSYSDGLTGSLLGGNGRIYLQTVTPAIYFYNNAETTSSCNINATKGTITALNFEGADLYSFSQNVKTNKGFYTYGKESYQDGKVGIAIGEGWLDICGKSNTNSSTGIDYPSVRFYKNGSTSPDGKIYLNSYTNNMEFSGITGTYNFDKDIKIGGTGVKAFINKFGVVVTENKTTNSNGNIAVGRDVTKYIILAASFTLADGSTTNCSTYVNGGDMGIHVENNSGTVLANKTGTLRYIYYTI